MKFSTQNQPKEPVDVCLLLEGTYPYVRGGVSSWVHQIILGLPDVKFYIIFLGGQPGMYKEPAYPLPDNVVGFELHLLLSDAKNCKPRLCLGNETHFATLRAFLSYFDNSSTPIPGELLLRVSKILGNPGHLTMEDFLYSRASWDMLTYLYNTYADTESFVDYFWTYRNIYQPLFILSKISQTCRKRKYFTVFQPDTLGFLAHYVTNSRKSHYFLPNTASIPRSEK
ncbi:Glycosyl Transferase [Vibrio sp. B1FLJ16]|nr:Glycosyl Transferase [Vibrio sp. B1FLJ16]CAE6934855.1 Glycosyl Transferase [Vibrio sp. B1FLJ16]